MIDKKFPFLVCVTSRDTNLTNRRFGISAMVWDFGNSLGFGFRQSAICRNINSFGTLAEMFRHPTLHWTRTSGNILQVDDKGNVTSFLKIVETELEKQRRQRESNLEKNELKKFITLYENTMTNHRFKSSLGKHTFYFYENTPSFNNPTVDYKEPWITDDYERNSFYLCNDDNETLQLIVGRSTVQIWHRFKSDPYDKGKQTTS
jgi:hypothetical protein